MTHPAAPHGAPQLTLAEEWLVALGNGKLRVATATAWARARVAEGGADGTLQALAQSFGANAEREVHAWAKTQPWRGAMPQPYAFQAPMRKHGNVVTGFQHCLLPHEVFASIGQRAPRVFEELFGSTSDREHFWAEMDRTARELPPGPRKEEHVRWLRDHPCWRIDAARRVPLGAHGDAGEMQGGEKVQVVSWGGVCRKGSTLDTRLLFCALKSAEMVHEGHVTLFAAFKVMAWSLCCMARGVHPEKDHNGVPFGHTHYPERAAKAGKPLLAMPDGRSTHGAWCELRGDWEFLRDTLHLKGHYLAGRVCHLCEATNRPRGDGGWPGHPFFYGKHFALGGPLEATLVGPYPRGPGCWETKWPVSPLCSVPGFSIWRCMFDLMHTLELGLLQRAIPAALQGLMGLTARGRAAEAERPAFGTGSRAARCKAATAAYQKWARANVASRSRVKAITPRWVDGSHPQIAMQQAKAAALRAMLPWVASLAEDRAGESKTATLRASLLCGLRDLDCVYKGEGRFLSHDQEKAAAGHCSAAMKALSELEQLTESKGPWYLTPKAHALLHIARDSAMANPRVVHCYQDEDFVGRVKRLYSACHGKTAPRRSLERYCLGVAVTITARDELIKGVRRAKARPLPGGPQRRGAAAADAAGAKDAGGSDGHGLKRGRGRPALQGPKRPVGRPRKYPRPGEE